MEETQEFAGLSMPVFTAFGWAGEETAIKYALSQLELFIHELHEALPRPVREKLPIAGLNRESQAVYIAEEEGDDAGAYIAFIARPSSLEIQLAIQDKKALAKGLSLAEKQPAICHRLITELGPEWSLRVQQMQIDDEEETEPAHYQDLFKDSITAFDEETAVALFSKAVYLNNEPQWVTPFYLSRRFPSEQVAAMKMAVIGIIIDQINALMPVFDFVTGQTKRKLKHKSQSKATAVTEDVQVESPIVIEPDEGFVYVTTLKPLHIRRGFINLTPKHWPFFAINSRTETRPVTIYYNGIYDKDSTVWRLVPNDQARIVLSTAVHHWLEDNFDDRDKIQIVTRKLGEEEIQISLKAVE
ncbi:MAG: hypothetical protein P8183_10410 [Anaerolineae bacterium]